ncbi:MAG: hypothetical protein KIT62_09340 [Cyclobacteriaceae bacterium]|nr:hypothetical protein [Cyclobacteriaceae bacterium]
MNNIDLIDNYLTNRLSDSQREAFEQQLASDPTLKADVEFQRQVIDGLKKARVAELKSMLNAVPVSPVREFTTLKVAAGIVGGALLIGTVYWFNSNESGQPVIAEPKDSVNVVTETELTASAEDENRITQVEEPSFTEEKAVAAGNKAVAQPVQKEAVKPVLEIVDPSAELVESTSSPISQGATSPSAPAVEIKSTQIDIDSANKKYKFHYQFANGKVVLYGSFDSSLYEIIELNGGTHSIYLYYQNKYYFLNDQSSSITPLEAVTDKTILTKLEAYRKK